MTDTLAPRPQWAYAERMSSGPKHQDRRPQAVSKILKPSRDRLGSLIGEARRLQKLEARLHGLLDPALAARIRVAGLRGGCLVLVTSSAALATRLRMDAPSLLRALGVGGNERAAELKVHVAPLPVVDQELRQRRGLPEPAKQALARFAADTGDETILAQLQDCEDLGED